MVPSPVIEIFFLLLALMAGAVSYTHLHLHEPFVNLFCIAAECHLVYLFLSEWREASFAQHLADFIESYLMFKIIWI